MSSPAESISPNRSIQNFVFLSSTATSLSDDKNSADLVEKRKHLGGGSSTSIKVFIIVEGTRNLDASPTSETEGDAKEANFPSKEKESKNDSNIDALTIDFYLFLKILELLDLNYVDNEFML
ncbi:unnamed protein product [Lupinus luteus]|uniref:Uncharacterized protein n=1 Tax=Lupinus luteus TaxID=3873 RepID=A0AAV1XZI2_LUPLU